MMNLFEFSSKAQRLSKSPTLRQKRTVEEIQTIMDIVYAPRNPIFFYKANEMIKKIVNDLGYV